MGAKNNKIDPRQLTGEALFAYYTVGNRDRDYAGVVGLLPMATAWDAAKTYEILERSVKEGRKLRAVYPDYDKAPPASWEYIGGITDGALYLA